MLYPRSFVKSAAKISRREISRREVSRREISRQDQLRKCRKSAAKNPRKCRKPAAQISCENAGNRPRRTRENAGNQPHRSAADRQTQAKKPGIGHKDKPRMEISRRQVCEKSNLMPSGGKQRLWSSSVPQNFVPSPLMFILYHVVAPLWQCLQRDPWMAALWISSADMRHWGDIFLK